MYEIIKNEQLKELLNGLYNNIDSRVKVNNDTKLDFATKIAALVHITKEIEYQIREIIKFNKPNSKATDNNCLLYAQTWRSIIIFNLQLFKRRR